jgi:hypothetical protein
MKSKRLWWVGILSMLLCSGIIVGGSKISHKTEEIIKVNNRLINILRKQNEKLLEKEGGFRAKLGDKKGVVGNIDVTGQHLIKLKLIDTIKQGGSKLGDVKSTKWEDNGEYAAKQWLQDKGNKKKYTAGKINRFRYFLNGKCSKEFVKGVKKGSNNTFIWKKLKNKLTPI